MTRLILLFLTILSCSIGYSQTEKSADNSEKITRLQQKNDQLVRRIADLESSIFVLKTELKASQEAVKVEIKRGLEIQAQNERAMNLALDGFAEKFEKQNETVKGVQEELSKKFNDQMLMSALGFVALVIIFTIASRSSTQKALKQNVANWNAFQEHLLKK
jgi:predicted RNase H-like nuclease (RuvC/YqgF family)